MKKIALLLLVVSSYAGVLAPAPARVESQQVKTDQRLQYEVVVTRKLIYVLVTDRQGKPVIDLGKDEFTLFDNGKQMSITEFENHALSLPGEERRPAAAAPGLIEKAPAPAAPLMSRTFFFLFDLVFADAGGFRLGRQAAIRFLEKNLAPGDRAAVLSFTGGRSLNVLHRPDGEREAAKRSINSIGLESLRPVAPIRPSTMDDVPTMTSESGGSSFSSRTDTMSGDLNVGRLVAGNFIWALDSLAQTLRYAPGRKIIVLYSNGLHPSYLSRGPYIQAGNADLGNAYQELCHKLASANTSVFSVNTEQNTYLVDQVPESRKGVLSLREITSETGGRFLGDIYAVPDHLEKIDAITASYYVLGYPIWERWDGRYHRIKVEVSRPGCDVNAQPGYFNAKPYLKYSDLEKKIHLVDLALSDKPLSQEPVRFAMQALPWSSSPRENVRFIAEIPVPRLGDVAGPRLEAVSLLFDGLDELVDTRQVELDLAGPEIEGRSVFLQADLSAPPGQFKCRVVIRNMDTGRAAIAKAAAVVPKPDPNALVLFPPLLLRSGGPSAYVWGASTGQTTGGLLGRSFPPHAESYVPIGFPYRHREQ